VALDTLTAEYEALTQGAGLVDRSERGKLLLTGSDVKEFLHGQVTNDIEGLADGQGCYAAFLTHKGKMLGDLRVFAFPGGLFLDCERMVLQDLFNLIRRFKLGRDVEVHKRTLERGLLSLYGPCEGTELQHRRTEIGGVQVREIVTDAGVDIVCDAADVDRVKAALDAVECSEDAAEIVRVESGRPRYGIDLDDTVIPQEAGLNERAVSFEKGCYVGQETVARLYYRGKPNRHLRGLVLSEPAATGDLLRLGEREVGRLGSSVLSPARGPIGLAIVRREAAPGDTVAVGDDGVTATLVELPFQA
jgi:folate-binding protein YgfZ